MKDSEFEFIRRLVYERSRISLGTDKRELVAARLDKRLRATNLVTAGEYCQLLKSPDAEEERANLIDVISTNHTFFFREEPHFDFLRDHAVPELTRPPRAGHAVPFQVWSAACSSGEEPYSIAMTLSGCLAERPWRVMGTDISHRILAKARTGVYRADTVHRLSPELVQAHFQCGYGPQDGNYRVKPALRERVDFHHLNLLQGEPALSASCQVIFCRNVMIYFDRSTQEELIARLTRWLAPGGYLFVGHSESLTHIRHGLRSVQPAIYQRPRAA